MDDYLTVREAAVALQVPYSTLMSWVYGNKIMAQRRGRWWFVHKDELSRKRTELAA